MDHQKKGSYINRMKFGLYISKLIFFIENNFKLEEGLKALHDLKIYHRDVKLL